MKQLRVVIRHTDGFPIQIAGLVEETNIPSHIHGVQFNDGTVRTLKLAHLTRTYVEYTVEKD